MLQTGAHENGNNSRCPGPGMGRSKNENNTGMKRT